MLKYRRWKSCCCSLSKESGQIWGVSERLRASRGSDYGRYPQLYRHPAHDSNQWGENV